MKSKKEVYKEIFMEEMCCCNWVQDEKRLKKDIDDLTSYSKDFPIIIYPKYDPFFINNEEELNIVIDCLVEILELED